MANIAVNQKPESCEGCYNLEPTRNYCKACSKNIGVLDGDQYLLVAYRKINDDLTKPHWCPLL